MARERISVYEGKHLSISYDRARCIHAAECGRGSRVLFDVSKDHMRSPYEHVNKVVLRAFEGVPDGGFGVEVAYGAAQGVAVEALALLGVEVEVGEAPGVARAARRAAHSSIRALAALRSSQTLVRFSLV